MPHALADLLLAQRRAGTTISDLPAALVPGSAAEAYAVQDAILAALGPVGAWKVAPMPAEGEPFCAPIPARDVHADGATLSRGGLHGLAVEVEVAVTLAKGFPDAARPVTPQAVREAIGSIHLALELVASRYHDRKAVPPLAAIADLQSNGAVVLGAPVPAATLPEFAAQAMSLSLDGEIVQTTAGNAATADVLASLAWLAAHAAARGLPLKPGDVVITGARLGPTPFAGAAALAEAPGLGTVSARFE